MPPSTMSDLRKNCSELLVPVLFNKTVQGVFLPKLETLKADYESLLLSEHRYRSNVHMLICQTFSEDDPSQIVGILHKVDSMTVSFFLLRLQLIYELFQCKKDLDMDFPDSPSSWRNVLVIYLTGFLDDSFDKSLVAPALNC